MSLHHKVIRVLQRNLRQSLKHRQLREAEDLLHQLKTEDTLSLETRGLELEFLIATERWPEAQSLADQLCRLHPDSARIQFLSGRLEYRQKQYDKARRFFEESNRLHPHWIGQRWLGKTCTQLGEFESAESLLLSVLPGHPAVNLDLAWLYERWEQPQRALSHVRAYLEQHPEDPFAKEQELRLKSQIAEPGSLSGDIEMLLELDEEIPPGMLPAYLTYLLESGQTQSARDFLSKHRSRFDSATSTSLGWVCYKLQAYDLATDLFIQVLPDKIRDVKFLSTLEAAARQCGRTAELIPYYELEAPQEKKLYGRIKSLRKILGNAD